MFPTQWSPSLPSPRTFRWIAAILAAALAMAVVQATAGSLFRKQFAVGIHLTKPHQRHFSARRNHYAALIPAKYRSDLVVARGILLEDGKPLPHRKLSVGAIDGQIWGAYAVTRKYVHFQPSDGGNPDTNGKHYALLAPRRVKPGILWGLFGALVLSAHCGFRPEPSGTSCPAPLWRRPWPLDRSRPWLEGTAVFLVALVGGGVALVRFAELSDGGLCVTGKPYSDAIGWHQVAVFLREGLGFTAHYSDNRPFYPIFQAMVFLVTGDSVAAAQGTNVFLLAMGAFFAYATARELFSWPVAAATLAFVVLAENHQMMAPMLLTELPAYAFGAAGVFLLARGCSPDPRPRRAWLLLLSGVFLGCSNLARPHTLLALPLCGLVILHAGRAGCWGWRPTFLRGCAFGCGIATVFLPWMLREKRVHDVWSISLNSSEMLYATAATKGGTWNAEEFEEAARDGYTKDDPAALHQYFSRRLAETVTSDPAAYATTVGRGWIGFLRSLTIEKPVFLGILALAVFSTLLAASVQARSALPLLGLPLFWMLGSWASGWRGYELLPAASLVLLLTGGKRARSGVLIAVVFIAGTGLLSAMVGNFALRRGEPILEWIFFMMVCAAALCLAQRWCAMVAKPAGDTAGPRRPEALALPGPVLFAQVLCGFMLLAGTGLIVRGMTSDAKEQGAARLGENGRESALAATRARFPEIATTSPDLLFAEIVAINDYRWKIPAGTDVGHWSRLFERRGQSRSTVYGVAGARPHPGGGLIGAHFRGSIDAVERKRPYLLVGIRNLDPDPPMGHDPVVIEGLALVPCDGESAAPNVGDALFFPPTREALAILAAKPAE